MSDATASPEHREDLRAPAETAVHDCLGLQPEESCLVVTDDGCERVGEAVHGVASAVTEDAAVVRYPPGDQHGEEPPAPVAAAMTGADVVFAPTTRSLSHTRARTAANEAGARVATLPGITDAVFRTGLDADYGTIADTCRRLSDDLAGAETVRITDDRGTDLVVEPGDREWREDTGVVHERGGMTNLPAGETFVSPATAEGRYVVDGTMMPHGRLTEPVEFTVEDGLVTEISDPEVRAAVEAAADEVGEAAYNLAELGVGANHAVTELVGSVLLDEKAAGTVHVAIGDDAGIGGDVEAPIHLDGILTDPTVHVDGQRLELP
jgi:leucyl aminopeptidase (aminopeptidase T)